MNRFVIAAAASFAIASVMAATDMAETARTVATVETAFSGTAVAACDDPGEWKFDLRASVDGGRDVVTVRISAPREMQPPKFGVLFRVPGAGVQNVWTSGSDARNDAHHLWPQLWWRWDSQYISGLARDTPIAVGFNSSEKSPVALACTEAMEHLVFGLYADDRTCEIVGRCEFFRRPGAPRREYSASILLDRRGLGFADTVRDCTRWVSERNGFRPAHVPESARDPVYSTWYAFLQDVKAETLEKEAALAASMGMKTMILDDGWQKVESRTFYSATGDWMPVASRFPDIKAHVAAVHKTGLKYMLWLGVPLVGDESKAYARFKDKLLSKGDGSGILDPRFPDVREYLVSTYERVVGEWGFDGVKLDFIDRFKLPENDPAAKDGYAGRDFRSLPEAVDRLLKDVVSRLRKLNPNVMIEFRQHYIGPAVLQYGNMMRASDCPADPCANRRRVCDLRLTSGETAVHSDMLVWSKDETPEGAALPILNVLFSTIQYSMVLAELPKAHADVIRHWLAFSQARREALLKGRFVPHHAENGYTWVEGESKTERVVATYSDANVLPVDASSKTVFLVNANMTEGAVVDSAVPAKAELFSTRGESRGVVDVPAGLSRVKVPPCGYARIVGVDAGRGKR